QPAEAPSAGRRGSLAAGGRPLAAGRWPLGVPDALVGEVGGAVTDSPDADEPHRPRAADLAEQALAGPEDDGEDRQSKLVGEVVLQQRVHQWSAGVDDDVPVQLALQPGDILRHVAPEHRALQSW